MNKEMLQNRHSAITNEAFLHDAGKEISMLLSPAAKLNARVLIVDDEAPIRHLLSCYFNELGYQCRQAAGGREALELLKNNSFDAVILDIVMPSMNGVELLVKIKSLYEDLAVVMISGDPDLQDVVEAMKLGADDFVTKPLNFEEVFHGLHRGLEKIERKRNMREYQRVLEKMIEERTEQVNHLLLNTIQALIHSIEAKDPFTKGHSARVTWLSQQLGKTSGCQIHDLELLQIGGMFHDLGKIGIRENVLLKNGALTRSEYDHIKTHPEIGVRILQPLAELKEILPIVLHHHEHYDGSGYPAGLQGEEIPLLARVISIADAYDAMISARPYRKALPMHEAIRRLKAGAGTQFDAHLIDLFLSIIQSNDFCQRFESEPDLSMPLIRQDNTIMNRLPSISQGPQTLRIC